jgi:hypothetical protein
MNDDGSFHLGFLVTSNNDKNTFDKQSFQSNDTSNIQVNFDIHLFEGMIDVEDLERW